jgi:hypothetical protein
VVVPVLTSIFTLDSFVKKKQWKDICGHLEFSRQLMKQGPASAILRMLVLENIEIPQFSILRLRWKLLVFAGVFKRRNVDRGGGARFKYVLLIVFTGVKGTFTASRKLPRKCLWRRGRRDGVQEGYKGSVRNK